MSQSIIVVDREEQKKELQSHNIPACTTYEYLTGDDLKKKKSLRVYNLSSSMEYQGIGYYVSLLAAARNHRVFPDVTTIQDLKSMVMQRIFSQELDELVQKKFDQLKGSEFELSVYFGSNMASTYDDLCRKLFNYVKAPLFRAYFVKKKKWHLKSIKLLSYGALSEPHQDYVKDKIYDYFSKKENLHQKNKSYLYDLAILYNPEEKEPPSDEKALQKFIKEGRKLGLRVDLLTKKDIGKILEYDALFIRETTNVDHHTYRIARMAKAEGLFVIDDPESILKCSNKVFLEEILDKAEVPRPASVIAYKGNYKKISETLSYPCVIKQPDSAFSQGVFKAKTKEEFIKTMEELFKTSELLVIQEYLPTEYDWRVGVLNNEVLFVCKYYMAKGHWQIYKKEGDVLDPGNFDTIPVEEAPKAVLKVALKVAKLVGKGLYGIDLKQFGDKIYVIEINDNPNVDSGIEDQILGNKLYEKVMQHFINALNKQRKIGINNES